MRVVEKVEAVLEAGMVVARAVEGRVVARALREGKELDVAG
jgi:hypothetical protein